MSDSKTKQAERALTPMEQAVLDRLNAGDVVSGGALAIIGQCPGAEDKTRRRRLREMIWHLRSTHRIPILSSSRGYWLAQSPDEIGPFSRRMKQVGRDHFAIASVVQKTTVDVVAGQMLLELFGDDRPRERDTPHTRAWRLHLEAGQRRIQIADVLGRTLELLKKDPELFEANKHLLAKEYGVMVLSPEEARNLRLAQKLMAGIGSRTEAHGDGAVETTSAVPHGRVSIPRRAAGHPRRA